MNGYPRDLHVLTHSFPTRRSSDLLTSANFPSEVEDKIMYSIIHKQPKRADIYWLVHVDVMDVPYCREYNVHTFIPNHLIRSEEHTSELQSLMRISYAVFCLKKKTQITKKHTII